MFRMKKNVKGIGLLELMLSLAIIAVLLIFVTQYYQQTQVNQQINAGIQAVQSAYAACSQAVSDGSTDCSLSTLVTSGYLNSSYAPDSSNNVPANPFGGTLTVDYKSGQYTVTLGNVPPSRVCTSMVSKIYSGLTGNETIAYGAAGTAGVKGSDADDSTVISACDTGPNSLIVVY